MAHQGVSIFRFLVPPIHVEGLHEHAVSREQPNSTDIELEQKQEIEREVIV